MGSLVSLVMSDIVGSTRRWAADDTAMAADLELHDRLVADVVATAGGRVFKHTGDGMIAVFDDPVAAVGAAAGIQRAVGDTTWHQPDGLQVRAAVHSGVVYERDGDMFGTAVNKLARILGVCPPGAVLVSNVVAALLAERAPAGLGVRAVGEVTLAGFTAPEALHVVGGSGLSAIGAIQSAAAGREPSGGAPPPIDEELVGRVEELAAVWEGLVRARVVTLVGVGGMGKTRLALEVAAGSADVFAGGVWWIDLASATSDDAVLAVAMTAAGAQEAPGRTAMESFCDRFVDREALVVIDNCEHVLAAAQELVRALRVAAPEVRVVATSREALGVRGEHLVPIGSLPVDDGVALFVERAVAVRPDIDISANGAVIDRLVSRLDGIPLAIELAAARCRSMTPTEIDGLLGDRFRLLRGGRSGAERHRTLQAAVGWSYEMLDPDERHVFLHLAVFAGGTLVDGLADVTGVDVFDVIDVVDRLISRSMVVATTTLLGTRYHQLETLRQYAEDRLVEADAIAEARDRHLAWAHRLATSIDESSCTPRAAEGFRRFCAEVDNLRVAVAHAVDAGRRHTAHEIVAAVGDAAYLRPVFEVADWVRPIRLDGDWTEAAALCASLGAGMDMVRGIPQGDGPAGGVPERFLTHPVVAVRHAAVQASTSGRWDVALEVLARASVQTLRDRLVCDASWLFAQYFHQVASPLADDELAEMHARGTAAIDAVRASGDEPLLAQLLFRCALAFHDRYPDEAYDLALEAIALGERVGVGAIVAYSTSALHLAAAGRGDAVELSLTERATALRDAINRGLAVGHRQLAGALTFPAFALIDRSDHDVALLMRVVWRRVNGVDTTHHLRRAGIPEPDDWDEWERRAAGLTITDAVALVVAALDRVIAGGSTDAASGPGGVSGAS